MKILLLPGLDGTGELFEPFRSLLPSSLAIDICSLPMQGDQRPVSLADFLATSHIPDGDVVLVAESFSGPVAYELIQRPGVNIKGIVLVSSFLSVPRPMLRLARWLPLCLFPWHWLPAWAVRWFCVGPDAADELVRHVQTTVTSVPPSILAARVRALSSLEMPTKRVRIPCLYLQPNMDRLVPKWHAAKLSGLCDDLKVQTIPGPHFLLQANPRECVDPVVEFVGKVTSGQTKSFLSNASSDRCTC